MSDTKDRIFEEIQKVINNHPVIILGSGSSISYGIASMGELSKILKKYFNNNPYTIVRYKIILYKKFMPPDKPLYQ